MTEKTPDQPDRAAVTETELAHPPEKVWRALTRPELLARWLGPNDLEPKVGARFTVRPKDGPAADCRVLEVEPERRLSFTWRTDGSPAGVVRFDLSPTPGGTALRISHTDIVCAVAQPRRPVSLRPRAQPAAGRDGRTRMQWAA